ncbi:MAG: uroporphyrinogen-III C-methyltransferase [Cyanobacteria bacterium J06588_5]
MSGKVYLLGAGPGDSAYLTVSGQQKLQVADALVYDALVDTTLLQQLPVHCEQWHVGKRGGQSSTPQKEINQLLVRLCKAGKQVVRLKAGDPFIFGRASAEIQALRAKNCNFEVLPGLSSALVAPLLAGVPLTDPVLSRGFGIFTAHDLDALDWQTLAKLETVVLLMGGRRLREICDRLISHGKRAETPMLIVRWAGQPQQQIWQGTVLSMAHIVGSAQLSPCIMVIGEVVGLRQYLSVPKQSGLPLAGKTVIVTRSASQASEFSRMLIAKGAKVVDLPALTIQAPADWQPMDSAIAHIHTYHWLILTSPNAVNYFVDRLLHQGRDLRALAHLKIAVVGKKTNKFLQQRGLTADFIPPTFVADSLAEHFPENPAGKKLLFPRVESGGRDVLVKAMQAKGADMTEVAAYESACPSELPPAAKLVLENRTADVITFASSKTVRHFAQLMTKSFNEQWLSLLDNVAVASIGPQTSQDCHELLNKVTFEAEEHTLGGLMTGLEAWARQ